MAAELRAKGARRPRDVDLHATSRRESGETTALAPGKTYVIGRSREVDVRFPEDGTMSREHGALVWEGTVWVLKNKSQHGSLVGSEKVDTERKLAAGDVLTLGGTRLVFEVDPEGDRADVATKLPAPPPGKKEPAGGTPTPQPMPRAAATATPAAAGAGAAKPGAVTPGAGGPAKPGAPAPGKPGAPAQPPGAKAPAKPGGGGKKVMIIIVVLLLGCCCCSSIGAYFNMDAIRRTIGR
ncbi:FHA domain-containing protein [bacterium]|nr:FHA domain-containing protein [bacterium]